MNSWTSNMMSTKSMSSKDSFDKLKGHSDIKQDINRRNGEVNGKEGKRLSKRLDDVIKVISDPDQWNANIASRDRMDEMEQRLEELEHRLSGMSYLVRRIVMNKRIANEDLQAIEDRVDNDNSVSGSAE